MRAPCRVSQSKKWIRNCSAALAAVALIALLFFTSALSSSAQKKTNYWSDRSAKSVEIPGAKRAGSDACQTCHAEVVGNFRHAFHAQQGVECEDCHGNGSLHIEGGGDITMIVSFRLRSAHEANAVCLSCHGRDERIRNWVAGSHASNGVRCADCHYTHAKALRAATVSRVNFDRITPDRNNLVEGVMPEARMILESRAQATESCLRCHQSQRGQMSLPYHHPLREGKVACQDCHDPHGGPAGSNLKTATANPLCLSCHAQYRGPFTYQHPPVTENCLTCHTPHGSPNSNLLAVSMPALCLQCHAGHHNGAGLPLVDRCTNCHGSVHGTDVPSATGGSVFVDKGNAGVPGPQSTTAVQRASAARLPAASAARGSLGRSLGTVVSGLLAQMWAGSSEQVAGSSSSDTFAAMSSVAGSYRFIDPTGYLGRVGEYDSLQQSGGGDVQSAYVSLSHGLSMLSRADFLSGDDYRVAARFAAGEWFRAGFDVRSFFQQQDHYAFYADRFSPEDIVADQFIPTGSVFGLKRRLGKASARIKLPKLPVHLFVKGDWQARVGAMQFAWYDMGGDAGCNFCHFTSQFQSVNYTTRNVGGGAEVELGRATVTWEHDYSSFDDRLQFPAGAFGATLGEVEELPPGVPDTLPGTYFLDTPSSSRASADTLRLNWSVSPRLVLNSHLTYTRTRDVFTRNPQNGLDSYTTLAWHPFDRLRLTANYGQQNLLNGFTPSFYPLFGNTSYHRHIAGLRGGYELAKHFDVETYYQRRGISRSNSSLWPQIYSPNNTDLLFVVPASFSNTLGVALRYRQGSLWSVRSGYEWTGTHDPGYLTEPKSNNRIFAGLTLSPVGWLVFTNDTSIILQNAFPVIQRRNRFYVDTADAALRFGPDWNWQFGYSYQQNKLNTYMAIQNDAEANYVLQESFVPYNQLSQTYWTDLSADFFKQRLELNARITYNSARSSMLPDLNPNDAALLGNANLIQQGIFDPVLFGQALGTLDLASTQISQVIVPQWIGQSRVYYRLPRGFAAGLLFNYGSYRDQFNPNLNGVLRTFNLYIRRTW